MSGRSAHLATQIELYDALKEPIGEEKARLVAEAIASASELATQAEMEAGFKGLQTEMNLGFAQLGTEIAQSRADTRQWMLTFFVPLWLGVYGTLAAVVVGVLKL
jgi:hypothetical protein